MQKEEAYVLLLGTVDPLRRSDQRLSLDGLRLDRWGKRESRVTFELVLCQVLDRERIEAKSLLGDWFTTDASVPELALLFISLSIMRRMFP